MSSYKCSEFVSLIVGFCTVTAVQSVNAHPTYSEDTSDPPSCSSVWVDPDGDGYGWDTLNHSYAPHSCVVTEASAPKPLYLREVNGDLRNIELIRPYWDANVDLASREIECSVMKWDAEQNTHTKYASVTLKHSYIRDNEPWVGSYSGVLTAPPSGSWSPLQDFKIGYDYRIIDGSYFGRSSGRLYEPVAEFNYYAPPLNQWLEIITVDGVQGVRLRASPLSVNTDAIIDGSQYIDCLDTAGNDFKPTGQWGQPGTSSGFTSSDVLIATGPLEPKPEVINPETQEPVEFTKAAWNLVTDVFGQEASCVDRRWYDSSSGGGFWDVHWDVNPQTYVILPPEPGTDENKGIFYSESYYGHDIREWKIDNGVIEWKAETEVYGIPSILSQWYEEHTNSDGDVVGVTYWTGTGRTKTDCLGLAPTGDNIADENVAGNCDYSDAAMFDGWGWNAATGEACPPLSNEGQGNEGQGNEVDGNEVESNEVEDQSGNIYSDDSDSDPENLSGNDDSSSANSDANSQIESSANNSGGGSFGLSLLYFLLLMCPGGCRSVTSRF